MARLSNEFLEKLAIERKLTSQKIQEQISRELRRLVEEIAKRYIQ
jgi:hypothetical protein